MNADRIELLQVLAVIYAAVGIYVAAVIVLDRRRRGRARPRRSTEVRW